MSKHAGPVHGRPAGCRGSNRVWARSRLAADLEFVQLVDAVAGARTQIELVGRDFKARCFEALEEQVVRAELEMIPGDDDKIPAVGPKQQCVAIPGLQFRGSGAGYRASRGGQGGRTEQQSRLAPRAPRHVGQGELAEIRLGPDAQVEQAAMHRLMVQGHRPASVFWGG